MHLINLSLIASLRARLPNGSCCRRYLYLLTMSGLGGSLDVSSAEIPVLGEALQVTARPLQAVLCKVFIIQECYQKFGSSN